MLLNMADFGKCWKSLQTSGMDSYVLANGFLIACGTILMDFGRIRRCPKLADFDQKACAKAHAFELGWFWQVLEIAQTFLKGLLYACKWISKCLRDYLKGFRVNSLGSELGGFWAKMPMLLNMADFGKGWKSLQTFWKDSYVLANGFLSACGTIWMDFGWIRWCPNLADFEQKAWAIAHAYEHGGFWQVLEIAPNFLKGLLCACKCISKCLRDYLNGLRAHSLGSEIGRF